MNKIHLYSVTALIIGILMLGVAYATTSTSSTITLSGSTPASVNVWSNHTPTWSPAANSAGSITNGNLYNVTVGGGDTVLVSIYLTNPTALAIDYEFLNMNISYGIGVNSVAFTPTFSGIMLSLSDGYVQFEITNTNTASNNYTVGIASGSFYSLSTSASGGSTNPSFYITVESV